MGSALAVTSNTGTLISQQRYMPFGEVRELSGSARISETDYGYTGQRELGMGLMDYRARMYDPALGRFVSPDTIVPGVTPQGLNRHSYVFNQPIIQSDPTGHCPLCIAVVLIGLAISASQIPSDTAHADPAEQGDQDTFIFGLTVAAAGPDIGAAAGRGLMGIGQLTGNPKLWAAGKATLDSLTMDAAAANASGYRIWKPAQVAQDYDIDPAASPATSPYSRPSNSVTPQQRASVQGLPCVYCGQITGTQIADHKTPLVVEYYQTGAIDPVKMRSVDAVQPSCPLCSTRQGAELSAFSKFMKNIIFGDN